MEGWADGRMDRDVCRYEMDLKLFGRDRKLE